MRLHVMILMSVLNQALSSCPCTVDDDGTNSVLWCIPNTISQFPEDISDCHFNRAEIDSIQLFQQPLKDLKSRSFVDFVHLKQLGISYCPELSSMSPEVFQGIDELDGLFIQETNLTHIPDRALDNLIRLRYLYTKDNKIQSPYVARAWHFCRRLEEANYKLEIKGELEIEKFLGQSSTTNEYCLWRNRIGNYNPSVAQRCKKDENNTFTCAGTEMEPLACELQETEFNEIIFEFPSSPEAVQDFKEAETNTFFEEFNGNPEDMEYAKVMTIQHLYGTKLDLSKALRYTSKKTEKMFIHADTVFMSEPATQPISFDIVIRSRRTSIDYPIPMKYTKDQLFKGSSQNGADEDLEGTVEKWVMKEEYIRMSDILSVRLRRLGHIEILDALPDGYIKESEHSCIPYHVNISEYTGSTNAWYDVTSINLNYIGARTLQTTKSNDALLEDMTRFNLNYINDNSTVDDPRAFVAGQKFLTIKEMLKYPDAHYVPIYTLNTIKDLADVLHNQLSVYRDTEILTEEEIFIAQGRVKDMQMQFDIVEAQQQEYISSELVILDAIFTSVNESWHWSFEHREEIKSATDAALQLIMQNMFEMQEQEYQHLLSQAEDEKEHYQETVDKYETQVKRYLSTAKEMMDYQLSLMEEMDNNVNNMEIQMKIFQNNAEEWKEEQEAKAVWGVFVGILTLGVGIAVGVICEPCMEFAIATSISGFNDITEQMEELASVVQAMDDIMAAMEELEDLDLDDMAISLTLNYKDSLETAIDMKKEAPMFEEMQIMADYTLQELNDITDHEIDGTTELQANCSMVSHTGLRLIDALSTFAKTMLDLAERQDELIVARQDLNRSIEQVEEINYMLLQLNATQQQYYNETEAARAAYEEKVDELEKAFDTATAEEKKKFEDEIMDAFDVFENTTNTLERKYNDALADLMSSIQAKKFGLRDASMNQRSMTMNLFYDACDTMFFSSFHVCDQKELPMMSDEFTEILNALSNIEWDTLTNTDNLPTPTDFDFLKILLKDNDQILDYPVNTLKESGRLTVNLKRYDTANRFEDFWRIRLRLIRLTLLQADGTPVPSPGITVGEEIMIHVVYPTAFNDTSYLSGEREKFRFIAKELYCNSDYITDQESGEPEFVRSCEVDEEFIDRNYKVSVDGFFSFTLENWEDIQMELVDSILVEISGSNIPIKHGDILTTL